jgi:hypothetical protein
MSRSGTYYLERQRVLLPSRHRPRYWFDASKSHQRPIYHLPELMGADGPQNRVITVEEEDRVPYETDCQVCTE